jgi:Uma2 family endonuclease
MATASIATASPVDADALYEVVDGQVVELPPMGIYETWIASLLHVQLHLFVAMELGRAVVEPLFDFTKTLGNKRRPDVAFVSYNRWPRKRQVPFTEAWDVVPNLAVEVVSPSNMARDVLDKLAEYFQVGVERVWVIYPSQRQIYVYTSSTDVKVFAEGDELTDDALLPGFRLPLNSLFDDTAAAK